MAYPRAGFEERKAFAAGAQKAEAAAAESNLARIATALERIADSLQNMQPRN